MYCLRVFSLFHEYAFFAISSLGYDKNFNTTSRNILHHCSTATYLLLKQDLVVWCDVKISNMLPSNQSAKKAKKANKKSKSGGKKLNRFFNLVGGGGGNNTKKVETEEYSIEANTAGGNGRKTTNEFYLSKINALEKVLTEMRKKKKKAGRRQSQECCRFVFQNHSSQGGIHKRRRLIFAIFDPPPPLIDSFITSSLLL